MFRIHDNDSIMCGFYCIAFVPISEGFYLSLSYCFQKICLDYTNIFSLNDYKKNDKIIYKYFKDKYVKSRV